MSLTNYEEYLTGLLEDVFTLWINDADPSDCGSLIREVEEVIGQENTDDD